MASKTTVALTVFLVLLIICFVVFLWYVGFFDVSVTEGFSQKINTPVLNPDVPKVRNSRSLVAQTDLKNPRELAVLNPKRYAPANTNHYLIDKRNPLGVNLQESTLFKRDNL